MVVTFATIFNDISVPRFDTNGVINELFHVPISYAAKEKVLARLAADPNIDRPSAVTLPRISFEMTSMVYDPSRKLNSIQKNSVKNPITRNYKAQFMPVPYNYHFSLWVYVKDMEDANKIIEQILPFFTPEFPVQVDLIPEMNVVENIPVILNSVNLEDNFDGAFPDRRQIIWTLDFTMKANLYGPITENKIIKFANVNMYIPTVVNLVDAVGKTLPEDRVTVQPGVTTSGQPTANVSLTIPYSQIDADMKYGYVDVIYGYLDNNFAPSVVSVAITGVAATTGTF
jgi:hypothetical protein